MNITGLKVGPKVGDRFDDTITNNADIEIQKAINATIGDVLNNTYSHVVEVPIVVSKVSPKNY